MTAKEIINFSNNYQDKNVKTVILLNYTVKLLMS
jgi:hypothetical protein